jgi:hypothetical protein
MWIKRHGLCKKLKKWTHEGPSTKEKNDEHMKAHALKKKKEER